MEIKEQDLRKSQLIKWLVEQLGETGWKLEVASADASFRRYFRIVFADKTLIAMDAPPDKENIKPFLHVASAFKALNVNVPEIYARDLSQGFMLLQDFGKQCFLDQLNEQNVDQMYGDAMRALLTLQCSAKPENESFPLYDSELLMREMALFSDWFLTKHLAMTVSSQDSAMLQKVFELLRDNSLAQQQVWVHRDYHSRNLMVYPQNNPGIIDFQDAVEGAVTYDLVSLLRDCYIAWPDNKVYAWVDQYLKELQACGLCRQVSSATFKRWFDLMGAQRHLKAIGIFSRLNYRDNKPGYLKDIPRTLGYVEKVSQLYPELKEFMYFITQKVIPALQARSK